MLPSPTGVVADLLAKPWGLRTGLRMGSRVPGLIPAQVFAVFSGVHAKELSGIMLASLGPVAIPHSHM